jgi:hypothetical protein
MDNRLISVGVDIGGIRIKAAVVVRDERFAATSHLEE